jgi:peptide/nickel transport system substrate-binding protein
VLQTSINGPRQKTQAIIKKAAAQAGIDVELKSVVASAFFSSDPANNDTASHFYADLQMYAIFMGAPDPEGLMRQFTSAEVASRANKWQRRNVTRFRNEDYDRLFRAAEVELDPVKRAGLFIRMNDLLVRQAVVVPIAWRGQVAAVSNRLKHVVHSGWESDFWRVAWWHA